MTFLSEWQVEYLNLVYGLVFVILASVSFGMGKTAGRRLPWVWLGLFGVTHGLGIWTFSLTTCNSDNLLLTFVRTGLLAVSFICLAEFGRVGIVRIQGGGPGRWVLIPLFIMAVLAVALKPGVLQAALLYMLGLAGGLPAAGALSVASRNLETHAAHQYKTGRAVMALYALFAGLLILPSPFLAELFSSETLFNTFSIPLQLFRLFLILWLTVAVWGCSQALFREDNGDKYLAARSKYALLAAAILIMVLCLGWNFTGYLEYNARDNLQDRSSNRLAALSSQLFDELNEADHAVAAIAGDNQVTAALLSGGSGDVERANQVLDRYHDVLETPLCCLFDIKGNVIASSNRNDPDSCVGQNYSLRPYFRKPLTGEASHYFALGVTSGERGYYASCPVRDGQNNIIGVAVVKRKIDSMEYAFKQHGLYFLIDPHGVIFMSSRPDMIFMSLRPLQEEAQQALSETNQFGGGPFQAVGLRDAAGGKDIVFEGKRYIQTSKFIDSDGWSLVRLALTADMRGGWLPGLFITLFLSFLTNIFLLVTQRSTEETARLSASVENYRSIFETTSAGTFIVEEDNTISLVNREFEKLSGYTKAELEGKKSWTDFTAGDDMERTVGYRKRRLINPDSAPRNYEVRTINRHGNFRNMLLTVDIIPGTKKSVVSAVDITERKKTEEALRVSEDRFYKIFNASPSIMSITTYGEGRFIVANERFLKELGYSIEEIIGLTAEEIKIWAKPGRAEIKKMLQDNGLINNLECTLRKKSGDIFTSLYSAEIVYFNGEQHILSVANDITEHKRLEEEMARLERLNLIGEMAAGIGHEIRNPMTTVRGFLQLLGSKKDSAHYREYYDLMIDELDRANTIITEFLSLARNRTVSKEMLNLNSIVEVLFPLIQADAMRTDKFIQLEVGDIPDLLLDGKEIRQLVLNLVRNGLEAMLPGGRVTIKTFKEGEKVVLAVQDEGKGIEPDVLEKLGTPFYTTKDYGTGLGLAVCYSIAARHNASIRVETGFSGATFYVIFTP